MSCVEQVVFAFQLEKLFVGALLDDVPVVEDDNLIGIPHSTQAVGNDEGRSSLHQGIHTLLYECFRTGINT